MTLGQEPVIFTVFAPADEQLDRDVSDPFPISFVQAFEELVQVRVVAEHKDAILLDFCHEWLNFGEDQTIGAEDAVVAEIICCCRLSIVPGVVVVVVL